MGNLKWHGWIVVQKEAGYRDMFRAEYRIDGKRMTGNESSNPVDVIEWWDQHAGERVKLLSTPLGAYRVYTGDLP